MTLKSLTSKLGFRFFLKVKMRPTLEYLGQYVSKCSPSSSKITIPNKQRYQFSPLSDQGTTVGTEDIFNTQLNWCNWIELQLLCLQLCVIICFTPECCFSHFPMLFPELWRWGSGKISSWSSDKQVISPSFWSHIGWINPNKLPVVSETLLLKSLGFQN